MDKTVSATPVEILLVEDSPGDVRLTIEAMNEARVNNRISVVSDGIEALDFLHKRGRFADAPRPDLVLLDLNLPKKSGYEVLEEIKASPGLLDIPVIVLTTSRAEQDIARTYALHANCYITKPVDFAEFSSAVRTIEDFWLSLVHLPPH